MSLISKHHEEVDAQGIGKCSVPMWMVGCPDGFCDKPAYGDRPPSTMHRRWDGFMYRDDGRYIGYVPGLACAMHGGPTSRVFLDGDAWCAVLHDFINLQESDAGFGETPEAARASLERTINEKP